MKEKNRLCTGCVVLLGQVITLVCGCGLQAGEAEDHAALALGPLPLRQDPVTTTGEEGGR
jgi:hypothetical protein